MQALKTKICLPTEDEIYKKINEIRIEREEFPNETILAEYEINGFKVPIFLLMECFEGNIDEKLLKKAIAEKDLSVFSDYECVHLSDDNLDFTNYVLKYNGNAVSGYCRDEYQVPRYIIIEFIAENELHTLYTTVSNIDILFAKHLIASASKCVA